MREINIHQAVDAIKAGQDIYLARRFTKCLASTEFFDADTYFVDDPEPEQLPEKQESAEQEQPKPKPKKKVGLEPIPLNYDEVIECRKAGMTYDAIARKMHCSPSTIINFLKREGQKRAAEQSAAEKGEQE